MYVNMQNNFKSTCEVIFNMRISHITLQHKFMLHVEIIYVSFRGRAIVAGWLACTQTEQE